MAFSLKIIAKINSLDSHVVEIEPSWWNYQELLKNLDFQKELNFGYLDYEINLSKQDFIEICEDQIKYLNKGVYSYNTWKVLNVETQREILELIKILTEDSEIKILIYEWETGLGD